MGNYEAIAYAVMALDELIKEGNDITTQKLRDRILYLMDMNTETMIYKKAQEKGLI
ncbi:hypothetical protein [Clostridium beijerinckii]|uniref:hypothetical protein n=1 Tax=Clostridium beijerinckii TaxID=1520 RepID=UPI0009D5FE4F|nr:hypothetical protein [Clostridium beijerinckii]MBA8937240.1 hypothetical protein [Clostridium beijerinckii]NRU40294.1 hypothetical protein [Clostridium beijerinckii]NSA96429.1 hypothetical protein [Clostridium beijerinckii]OOM60664.1 hypothetical protein CLOBI_29520 [Clostridium beijerinckii]OOM68586.1 hypothetical protein CLBEIC_32430 [Clostridium beijerinckii]